MTRRPRRLRAIRTLLEVMLVVNVLALAQAGFALLSGHANAGFEVDPGLIFGPQQFNNHVNPTSVSVDVEDPGLAAQVLGLVSRGLAYYLATLPMIIFARRLVHRAIDNHPFTTEMVGGLRRLGRIVLAGGLLAEVARVAALITLYDITMDGGYPVTDNAAAITAGLWWWLPMGLLILAFAQIIEHGYTLRAELDEVI